MEWGGIGRGGEGGREREKEREGERERALETCVTSEQLPVLVST